MQKKYKEGIEADKCNDTKTELEELCEANLKEAQRELVKQQEIVLKYQAQVKVALEMYNRDKNLLEEEFEHFCHEKFGTLLPELNRPMSPIIVSSFVTILNTYIA